MSWRNIIPPAPEFQELKELTTLSAEKIPEIPEVLTSLEQEQYEERAAIIEFDGGLTRQEAEELAKNQIAENRND
jgi:hypothetical protein